MFCIQRSALPPLQPQLLGDVVRVLVTPPGQVDQDVRAFAQRGRHAHGPGHRVGAFQRRDDAFDARECHEGIQALFVVHRLVVDTATVLEVAVLRPDTRVIEARGNACLLYTSSCV